MDQELNEISLRVKKEVAHLKLLEQKGKSIDLTEEIAESKIRVAKLKREYALKKLEVYNNEERRNIL